MKQEEKQLLLKDLCARLPYLTMAKVTFKNGSETIVAILPISTGDIDALTGMVDVENYLIKPYLRHLSSMTDGEKKEYHSVIIESQDCSFENSESSTTKVNDWLLSNHFDVRGLIEKGLALEAPEDMYKTERQ